MPVTLESRLAVAIGSTVGVAAATQTSLPVGAVGLLHAERIGGTAELVGFVLGQTATFHTALARVTSFFEFGFGMAGSDGSVTILDVALTRAVATGVFGYLAHLGGVGTSLVQAKQLATTTFAVQFTVASGLISSVFAGLAGCVTAGGELTEVAFVAAVVAVTRAE